MRYIRVLKYKKAGYILLGIYLIIGIIIFKDYGISWDELTERKNSLISYKYILNELQILEHVSDNVKESLKNIPDLLEVSAGNSSTSPRATLYGFAFQLPTVLIEHIFDFKLDTRNIYLMRHIYNFLNYVLGCLCFYLILFKRFSKMYIPFLGLLMLILTPRFFAEAFYNNKDIAFASWYIISIYCALRFLENKTIKNLLLFSFSVALATNIRIMGVSIFMLTLLFNTIEVFYYHDKVKEILKWILFLTISSVVFYILITPASWANPFRFIVDVITTFSDYPWTGKNYYMGKWISRNVPWHYIPVWITLSMPLMYTFLFLIGSKKYCLVTRDFFVNNSNSLKVSLHNSEIINSLDVSNDSVDNEETVTNIKNKNILLYNISTLVMQFLNNYLYDTFLFLAFWCSLLGYIALRISLYTALRHVYFIVFPFIYLAILGLDYMFQSTVKNTIKRKFILGTLITSMMFTCIWIVLNHPYQFVYSNFFLKNYAFENFERDGWRVSSMDMYKYIAEIDQRNNITISHPNVYSQTISILPKEIRTRFSGYNYRNGADYRVDQPLSVGSEYKIVKASGYKEIYNVSVEGHKIGVILKYLIDSSVFFNDMNVKKITSSENIEGVDRMIDGKPKTYWDTARPQTVGDTVTVEFNENVNYNILRLNINSRTNDYPRKLQIYISMDGQSWEEVKFIWNNRVDYIIEEKEYRFLKLENNGEHSRNWWSISELNLGVIEKNVIDEILQSK